MKKSLLTALFALTALLWGLSCTQEHGYDPDPGPNTDEPVYEPPTSPLAMKNVEDPRIAEEDGVYWVFSSNANMNDTDYPYEAGLMVRKSDNLVDFSIQGYVLSDVIDSWAKAKLVELSGDPSLSGIRICRPAIAKVGGEWRLYYTVNAGTDLTGDAPSVIGYATSPTLDNAEWSDQGQILGSASLAGTGAIAANPCFFTSIDETKHYLLYGGSIGLYVTELGTADSKPTGSPTLVAQQGDRTGCSYIHKHNNRFYLFLCFEHGAYSDFFMAQSLNPAGPFIDYSDDDARNVATTFPENRILTPYQFWGSKWGGFNSLSVVWSGTRDMLAVNCKPGADAAQPYTLQIRYLDWVSTPKGWDFPAVCPEPYAGDQGAVTDSEIVGTWGYGTLWYVWDNVNNTKLDAMNFGADHVVTYGDATGNWDFDETTSTLHFVATWWGSEHIYLKVNRVKDTDSTAEELPENLVAAGFNANFNQHPGVWMKKSLE